MNNNYGAGFEDNPSSEAPQQAVDAAIASSLSLQQQGYKLSQDLSKKLLAARTAYLRRLTTLMTPAKYAKWKETKLKHRNDLRAALAKVEPSYEGEMAIKNTRKEIIAKAERFTGEIAFNTEMAKPLRDQHSKNLAALFKGALDIPDKHVFLTATGPTNNPHPWTAIVPPYSGSAWEYYWEITDEPSVPSFARYLDRAAGQLGSYTFTRVYGADDSDYSFIWYRTGVRFWYKMPAAGILELYLKLQAIYDNYWGDFDNEWGWSDAHCLQLSRPYVRVISPTLGNIRYGNTILNYNRYGTSDYWNRNVVGPGNYGWAYSLSDASYPANQWLYIEAGMYDYNYFWSNDVTIESKMNMKWFVPSIYVRPKT